MVANQGYLDPLIKPKDFLKKLKKSTNGKYFVGVKDWNDSIRRVLVSIPSTCRSSCERDMT